ncbi:TPA: hypothetical protein KC789_005556, partial [Escherichia coli O146]|nr:hypothetical protein [Escherichia coli O146]
MQNNASDTLLNRILNEPEPVPQLPGHTFLRNIYEQTEAATQRQRKENNRLNSEKLAEKICRWIKETGRG